MYHLRKIKDSVIGTYLCSNPLKRNMVSYSFRLLPTFWKVIKHLTLFLEILLKSELRLMF